MSKRNHRSTSTNIKRLLSYPKSSSSGSNTMPRDSSSGQSSKFYSNSSENSSLSKCRMKGWLKRQSVGLVKSWQMRWFVLSGDFLHYYSSQDESKSESGRIYLPGHCVTEHPFGEQQKFVFELALDANRASGKTHLLCADSEDERKEWVKHIKEVLYAGKGGAIFGRPLELTLKYERMKDRRRKIPELVQTCVEFLESHGLEAEGLFRLPGRAAVVRQLRNAFDVGERPNIDISSVDVHSIASLLKSYLRELPSPIIPIKFYEPVMHIITRELELYPEESIEKLANIISALPWANFNLLRYLCCFLHEVGRKSEVNKMTDMNLATVFSQSFIEPEDDDPALLMGTADNRTKAAFILISRVDQIFTERTLENDEDDRDSEVKQSPLNFNVEHFSDDLCNSNNGELFKTGPENEKNVVGKTEDVKSSNYDDWTMIEKCFEDQSGGDFADRCNGDRVNDRQRLRRSASLGDELFRSDSTGSDANGGNAAAFTDPAAVDSSTDSAWLDRQLACDPTQLTHEELVARFMSMRDELHKQRVAFGNVNNELARTRQSCAAKMRIMAESLKDERAATADAVSRIVNIQAELEKYHLLYGPMG